IMHPPAALWQNNATATAAANGEPPSGAMPPARKPVEQMSYSPASAIMTGNLVIASGALAPRSNPESAAWTLDCFGAKRAPRDDGQGVILNEALHCREAAERVCAMLKIDWWPPARATAPLPGSQDG